MVRLISAVVVPVLLGWQAGAVAAVAPASSPVGRDLPSHLVGLGGHDPAALAAPDGALTERLLPVQQAEIDRLLERAARLESGRGAAADPGRAFAYYQAAALRGDGFAQEQLGRFYETGVGVGRDIGQAVRWYEMAAYQNFPAAQLALTRLLSAGEGIRPRPEQAYVWMLVFLANPAVPADTLREVRQLKQSLEQQLGSAQIQAARNRARQWKVAGPDR